MSRLRVLIVPVRAAVLMTSACVLLMTPSFSLPQEELAIPVRGEPAPAKPIRGAYQGPPRAIPVLEPIIKKTCSQCHRFPPPETLPKKAWLGMLNLMSDLASAGQPSRPLNDVRFDELVTYFTTLAPDDLDAKPWTPAATPSTRIQIEHVASFGGTLAGLSPGTSHVKLMHLWEDSPGPQLVVTDMMSGWIMWAEPKDLKAGLQKIIRLSNPSHVEMVDLDKDGRMDLIVGDLGTAAATDQKAGSVVWLRRTGKRTFEKIPIATRLGRVADVQAADFNGDGKLDLVVADFGRYTAGQILYLENRSSAGKTAFTQVPLAKIPGTITLPVLDLNGDGKPDFVALIAQSMEAVVGYINTGKGQFESRVLWAGPNPVWGFSGIAPGDLNGDGRMDFVVTNGDTVDDGVHFKPYQGVGWLENKGDLQFEYHNIGRYYGAYAPKIADADGDGDLDVIVTSFLPGADQANQRKMALPGIVWYEQVSPGVFLAFPFPDDTCYHPTLEAGDIDGDGNIEVITGSIWLRSSPFSLQSSSVDIWRMRRVGATRPAR